ncbi:MAG: GPR endopeptidase [Clostridia bacterium]|nr:GPR endopeptidase [Clostridia bacterium]
MKKYYRTDLGCEKSLKEKSKYNLNSKEINEISCIFLESKASKNTESVIIYTGKTYMYNDDYLHSVTDTVSKCLKELIPEELTSGSSILICGLGNRNITADSLGPYVTDKLYPTVTLKYFVNKVYLLSPGVEGQSGFSTFNTIKNASTISKCDLIVAVDSLCAKDPERLLSTIQLSAQGIMPGSGVGNHKNEISKKTVGVPVISIGVPTVSDLSSIAKNIKMKGYYVSPSDVDICVDSFADIIASTIEKVFYKTGENIKITNTPAHF